MSVKLNNSNDCCNTDCTNTTVNVPGPQGVAGADGTNGANGIDGVNAYSTVKAAITVPAVGQTINLYVVDHAAFAIDQIVVISGIGHFRIGYKATDGSGSEYLGAVGLGYPNDSGSTGATIAVGTEVSPAGPQGPAGGGSDQLTAQGDLLTRTSTAVSSLSAEGNGSALFTDPTAPTGLEWRGINFTDVNGKINLGTQTDTTTKLPLDRLTGPNDVTGDLAYYNGTSWARLQSGSDGQILTVNSNVPAWASAASTSTAVRCSITTDGVTAILNSGAMNVASAATENIGGIDSNVYRVTFISPVDVTLPVLIQDSSVDQTPLTYQIKSRTSSDIVFQTITSGDSTLISLIIFN